MKLKVIGSGSSGNCYILDDGKHILMLEAGVPFSEVKEEIDYEVSRIAGVLSSHEHGDHRKYLQEFEAYGIPVVKGNEEHYYNSIYFPPFFLGDFTVIPFDVVHDVPCFGYVIDHPDMGRLVFVTDTEYVKFTFPGVNHIMVEANYAQDILDENMNSGEIPKGLRDRIMKSHMSFDTARKMVEANKSSTLMNVIMCHLSRRNSDHKRFMADMQETVGEFCNVLVAKRGREFDLSKFPF